MRRTAFTVWAAIALVITPLASGKGVDPLGQLVEDNRHYPLTERDWDDGWAAAAVQEIIDDAEEARQNWERWPPHPLDADGGRSIGAALYEGETGIYWALHNLSRRYRVALQPSDEELLALEQRCAKEMQALPPQAPKDEAGSLFFGPLSTKVLRYARDPRSDLADEIFAICQRKRQFPSRELMWGAPGVMLIVLEMHRRTDEDRWAELYREFAGALLAEVRSIPAAGAMWAIDIYGFKGYLGLGPFHGFLGHIHALRQGRHLLAGDIGRQVDVWAETTLFRTLVSAGPYSNWPQSVEPEAKAPTQLQLCHGAPGVVALLADLKARPAFTAFFQGAAELIWAAGPVRKGPGLCHGTAGNGFALLAMYQRTGDELWLRRARQFAIAAVEQVRQSRSLFRQGRYGLWNGDIGVALFVDACRRGDGRLPQFFTAAGDC